MNEIIAVSPVGIISAFIGKIFRLSENGATQTENGTFTIVLLWRAVSSVIFQDIESYFVNHNYEKENFSLEADIRNKHPLGELCSHPKNYCHSSGITTNSKEAIHNPISPAVSG